MISKQFIDELVRDADIVSVIGQHVKLAGRGGRHKGLCPFHQEKTASFSVDAAKGFYHCFGCGASGSTLGFLMSLKHGGDFVAAVEDLAKQMGRQVVYEHRQGPRAPVERLATAARHYHVMLGKSAKARDYLKGRGLGRKTAMRFNLGYAPADGGLAGAFDDYGKGGSMGDLVRVGLVRKGAGDYYPYFKNRVMFPIASNTGRVIGFGGRLMGDGEPKYLNSPQSDVFDKGTVVYGLRESTQGFKDEGFALVVEGYMDVVMLSEQGLRNAVATMGTAATTQQVKTIMTRSDEVVFCFDGDEAGNRAMGKALKNVMPALKDGQSVRFVRLPESHDPDSFTRENGADALRDLVKEAMPLEEAMVDKGLFGEDGDDAGSESALLKTAAELLAMIDKPRARMLYASLCKRIAQVSGIDAADIKAAVDDVSATNRRQAVRRSSPVHKNTASFEMRSDELFEMLVCVEMDRGLLDQAKGAPKFSKRKEDIILCTKALGDLMVARASGDDKLSVAALLASKGYVALARRIKDKASIWERSKMASPAEKMDMILRSLAKKSAAARKKTEKLANMA